MATLTLCRTKNHFGSWRRLKVVVDGVHVVSLWRSRSASIYVTPGRHLVQARMDWLKSAPWVVEATDAAPIQVTFSLPFLESLAGSIVPSSNGIQVRVEWAAVEMRGAPEQGTPGGSARE